MPICAHCNQDKELAEGLCLPCSANLIQTLAKQVERLADDRRIVQGKLDSALSEVQKTITLLENPIDIMYVTKRYKRIVSLKDLLT